jgi:hypothetical protein
MSTQDKGASSGPVLADPTEQKDYVVKRDNEGPFTFTGVQLARVTRKSNVGLVAAAMGRSEVLEAAVYRTKGGSYITALSKTISVSEALAVITNESEGSSVYNKAAVHKTFDDAVAWFKPGRLTDELRRQLGLDQPVHID